jgi:hypothetical protein
VDAGAPVAILVVGEEGDSTLPGGRRASLRHVWKASSLRQVRWRGIGWKFTANDGLEFFGR